MLIFPLPVLHRLHLALLASLVATTASATPPGQSGMAVVRDPQTGQLRAPTAAELRELQPGSAKARLVRPQQGANAPTVRPDGVRAATLGERGMVYSVITRGADGKLSEHCVEGEAAAAHATHATPATPAAPATPANRSTPANPAQEAAPQPRKAREPHHE